MYQQEMFKKLIPPHAVDCGEGHVASVLDLGDGWVFKQARIKDETLNYLEWCVMMTAAGKKMMGMPIIDRLIPLEEGYVVLMKKYQHRKRAPMNRPEPCFYTTGDYCCELIRAYREYMQTLFGEVPRGPLAGEQTAPCDNAEPRQYADDLHGANYMWCSESHTWIVTDPSARSYLKIDTPPPLELH